MIIFYAVERECSVALNRKDIVKLIEHRDNVTKLWYMLGDQHDWILVAGNIRQVAAQIDQWDNRL